jgi:VIT1/CCC1 family predicted Fe2+/Mn2+ transporter
MREHVEKHFTGGEIVRDVVLGMSDGLTVPFALAAGLSGAVASSRLVVTAGLAEIVAGSIAMGLGGFLAARSDAEHYASEKKREQMEVREKPDVEANEVREVFSAHGLTTDEIAPIVEAFRKRPDEWVEFMMRFELNLEPPEPSRAWKSALTIAVAYAVGGAIPLMPYVLVAGARRALVVSAAITVVALAVFGFVKGRFTGAGATKSAVQTVITGALAAGAAFLLARAVS